MGKWGGRRVFCQAEPIFPLPYSAVPVLGLRDARPVGWVTCYIICASTMPRAIEKGFIQKARQTVVVAFRGKTADHCFYKDCVLCSRQIDRGGQWRQFALASVSILILCRDPKTGQQKVQLSSKTKHFAHLGILFIFAFLSQISL